MEETPHIFWTTSSWGVRVVEIADVVDVLFSEAEAVALVADTVAVFADPRDAEAERLEY
jgi:hypothetical protein